MNLTLKLRGRKIKRVATVKSRMSMRGNSNISIVIERWNIANSRERIFTENKDVIMPRHIRIKDGTIIQGSATIRNTPILDKVE